MSPPSPARAALLDRVLVVGVTLAERLLDIPTTPDPDAKRPRNPATDYQNISYAVRQTVILLEGDADARQARRTAARKQVIRAVEDAIHLHAAPRADHLVRELQERLADPDFDAELDARPTPDLIAELCRDLHALPRFETHAHQRRHPAAIAALAAQAAAPAQTPLNSSPSEPEDIQPPQSPTPFHPRPTPRAPLSTPSRIRPIRDG